MTEMCCLVVGVDGSESSANALEWAATTVGPAGSIHAITAVSPLVELTVDVVSGDGDGYLRYLRHQLSTSWTGGVGDRVGQLTTDVRDQTAAEALAAVAIETDADAIVVGAHVRKALALPTVGHTTRQLLHHLTSPLIVVPNQMHDGIDEGGPVMVGIGHGDATEAAVWWASQLADERGLTIGLVRATGDAPIFQSDGLVDLLAYYLEPEHRTEWTVGDVNRLAAAVQDNSDHDLVIETSIRPGLPAVQLVAASEQASMLVIGQHWSAISQGHLTPQPLRYALQHARCPVAVIPEAAMHSS